MDILHQPCSMNAESGVRKNWEDHEVPTGQYRIPSYSRHKQFEFLNKQITNLLKD